MIKNIMLFVVLGGMISKLFNVAFNNDIEKELFYVKGSTKTPYQYVQNKNTVLNAEVGENCELIQIWLLFRHGTRYPSKNQIKILNYKIPSIAKLLYKNKENIHPKYLDLIDELVVWKPNARSDMSVHHDKILHKEGEREMTSLGKRFSKRFASLFKNHTPEAFIFNSTNEQRAIQSRLFFAKGFLKENNAIAQLGTDMSNIIFTPVVSPHDPILRMYKLCKRWYNEVKRNPLSLREKQQFENSKIFNHTVLLDLNKRLGFLTEQLDINAVDAIDVACTFGQAWDPNSKSPWCGLLTEEMSNMLEYRKDLKYYWQDGYGYPINGAQACVLIKDAIRGFDDAIDDGTSIKGRFHFTHSGTILKLLAYLGLYQENERKANEAKIHLNSDNFYKMKSFRNWRTSLIDPFAANVGLVLKKCDKIDYKIGIIHNENMIKIPACKSFDSWCDYDVFLSLFNTNDVNCKFSEICSTD